MAPTLFPDAGHWPQDNFGGVQLGLDCRRDRLVYPVTQLARQPGATLPAVSAAHDRRCFYASLQRPEASHDALLAGHRARTKQSVNDTAVVLIIRDTTEPDYTSHKALNDQLGPIGDGRGRGLLRHNSLAVRASDGLLLGPAHRRLARRQEAPVGGTRTRRKHRRRESALWEQGLAGVGPAPQGACRVDVCDRGGDLFEALHAAVGLGRQALIRACQDRRILIERDGRRHAARLPQQARGLAAQADDTVQVRQKGGRPARTAQVRLAACAAWIEPPRPWPKRRGYQEVAVWVIRVREEEPPPAGEAPEGVPLSTLPARTPQELRTGRDWYAWRWPAAEDDHQAEKTGCGEGRVRFQDHGSLSAVLALLSAVAVRVVRRRQAARACPQAPAEQVAAPLEIAVTQQALGLPPASWTVTPFVRGVAQSGGFLGRTCDGEPGGKTWWRGYQRLRTLPEGVRLAEQLRRHAPAAATDPATAGDRNDPP